MTETTKTEAQKPAGPYAQFATNKELEKNGVELNYGPFYLIVARAGGANQAFKKRMDHKFKPYRRALQTETMDEDLAEKLVREVYAETVVKGGGSEAFGPGFIPDADGNKMEVNQANIEKLFTDLPDLYSDVKEQATRVALYRDEVKEADAKN